MFAIWSPFTYPWILPMKDANQAISCRHSHILFKSSCPYLYTSSSPPPHVRNSRRIILMEGLAQGHYNKSHLGCGIVLLEDVRSRLKLTGILQWSLPWQRMMREFVGRYLQQRTDSKVERVFRESREDTSACDVRRSPMSTNKIKFWMNVGRWLMIIYLVLTWLGSSFG